MRRLGHGVKPGARLSITALQRWVRTARTITRLWSTVQPSAAKSSGSGGAVRVTPTWGKLKGKLQCAGEQAGMHREAGKGGTLGGCYRHAHAGGRLHGPSVIGIGLPEVKGANFELRHRFGGCWRCVDRLIIDCAVSVCDREAPGRRSRSLHAVKYMHVLLVLESCTCIAVKHSCVKHSCIIVVETSAEACQSHTSH
jgi:hypothetical protein